MTTAEYIRSLHDKDLEIILSLNYRVSPSGEVYPLDADCPEKEKTSKWPKWLRKLFRKG